MFFHANKARLSTCPHFHTPSSHTACSCPTNRDEDSCIHTQLQS